MAALRLVFCALVLAIYGQVSLAQSTIARAAMVLDQTTGTVLLAKNENTALPPASMSKLMTLNMLFEALQDGRITLDTKFSVSAKASKKGGSKMFLREGERVRVEDLILGIIVLSGNDACIVVAENLAGSEDDFARIMTTRARQLGMEKSVFKNSTGWPDPEHVMSAKDLVTLADRIITQFPEYYKYFGVEAFSWAGIDQNNRNPLLGLVAGADGLKTGHTVQAGFGLVGSAVQGDRRVIVMITGLDSASDRAREGERLMNWAFRQFAQTTLIKAEKKIAEVPVWLGQSDNVGLIAKDDISALVPYVQKDNIKLSVTYTGPLQAPVVKGTQVAMLNVEIEGLETTQHPLYTDADVEKSGIVKRLWASIDVVMGMINQAAAP